MKPRNWVGNLMMILSILAALILVPAGFILSGRFSSWLKAAGVHASPNLADGYTVADFDLDEPVYSGSSSAVEGSLASQALSLLKFSVKRVVFGRWSGIGIAPRLNLSFEFAGRLPDPHNSRSGFSGTVIHVYIKTPASSTAEPVLTNRIANLDTSEMEWDYEVIVDGFHEQARIYDTKGNLVSEGLGLYVEHPGTKEVRGDRLTQAVQKTRITAALPMEVVGDPSLGAWRYYVLVGLPDSRHPSMMLHSGQNGMLETYGGAIFDKRQSAQGGKPRLRPLFVNHRS